METRNLAEEVYNLLHKSQYVDEDLTALNYKLYNLLVAKSTALKPVLIEIQSYLSKLTFTDTKISDSLKILNSELDSETINSYFIDSEIFRVDLLKGDILPINVRWEDVSTSLLDVFINEFKPMLFYALDYYSCGFGNLEINKQNKSHRTELGEFDTDSVIVSKLDDEDIYMFFWYHKSGRCYIGRFKTNCNIVEIEKKLINWLKGFDKKHLKLEVSDYLRGYISY